MSTIAQSSSSSSPRRQLNGSYSFTSPSSSAASWASRPEHHRTASSTSPSPSASASASASHALSSSSSARRSPLPQPILPSPWPSASPSPPPGNPLDNAALLALIGARKFQYMQTFIQSDPTPALVLPNLYLGSIGAARNLAFLRERRISHILTIGNNLPVFFRGHFEYLHLVVQDGEKEDIRRHFERCVRFVERGRGGLGEASSGKQTTAGGGVEEEKREAEAAPDERHAVADAAPSAASAAANGSDADGGSGKRVDGEGTTPGTGVLLHCFAGRSRSVTILLAYLLTLVHRNPPTHPDIQSMLRALDLPATVADTATATASSSATAAAASSATAAPAASSPSSAPPLHPTPLTLSRLFDYVKQRRPEIKPNAGFVAQLLLLERELQSVSHHLARLHIGGGAAGAEVEAAVVGVGRVGEGEVGDVERQCERVVQSMAGTERGQEWRQF